MFLTVPDLVICLEGNFTCHLNIWVILRRNIKYNYRMKNSDLDCIILVAELQIVYIFLYLLFAAISLKT